MNIPQLKETIINNPTYIKDIMEKLELHKIRDYGTEWRCARYEHYNPTGICVKKDNLGFIYRSADGDISGDIITMVQEFKKISFTDALKFICDAINITYESFNKSEVSTILPFGGYFNEIKKDGSSYQALKTYDEDILKEFWQIGSKRFQKDGINLKTQKEFNVCYDLETDRVVVPWRNEEGKIVGLMGRANYESDDENFAKWYPILPYKFNKSNALFGFSQNYNDIQKQRMIIVSESEKAPMQLRSMERPIVDEETGEILRFEGINLGVAVGSHSITEYQRRLILSCFPNNIIIAFDEDIDESYLIETAKKLQYQSSFFKANIGYIKDREGIYLPKGSKCSPTDMGRDIFEKLIKECLYWI